MEDFKDADEDIRQQDMDEAKNIRSMFLDHLANKVVQTDEILFSRKFLEDDQRLHFQKQGIENGDHETKNFINWNF